MEDVDNKVKMIVEGLLLAAGRPLTLDNIIQVFSDDEKPDRSELKAVMDSIAQDCNDRGFELKEVSSGFRFQVKQDLSEWVAKLWEERPPRYTRALLETLSLIAYRQPITRGDIEEIRGVAVSSNIIRTLLDREWVRVVGHRDVPGRPAMFATTKQFLDYFNLKNLQELPPLSEIKELDKLSPEEDLEDDLRSARVLELPEDAIDENSFETVPGDEDLLAVEEAIELAKKPLDEILNLDPDAENDLDPDRESDSEEGVPDSASDSSSEEPDTTKAASAKVDPDYAEAAEDAGQESTDDDFDYADDEYAEDLAVGSGDEDSFDDDEFDASSLEFSIEDDTDESDRD